MNESIGRKVTDKRGCKVDEEIRGVSLSKGHGCSNNYHS